MMSLAYAALLIGVLIFVHELGHFLVAKLFDVKVLRFSIGFGPKVVGFTRGETEYVVCALPLGGYVQMLGMTMESAEDIAPEDRPRALMAKPIWQRSLVVLAGPAFNILFPILLYFCVIVGARTEVAPSMVGDVFSEMPAAAAGLAPGDLIVEIDGKEVNYWHQVIEHVTPRAEVPMSFTYVRDGERHTVEITPDVSETTDFLGLNDRRFGMIGIHSGTYGPTIGIVRPDAPAAQAGLRSFDRIISINGVDVTRFDEVEAAVRRGEPMRMAVWRREAVPVQYGQFYSQRRIDVEVTPQKTEHGFEIGVRRAEMFLSAVGADGPAHRAGLQVGDEIIAVNGSKFSSWSMMNRQIENAINSEIATARQEKRDAEAVSRSFEITYRRDDVEYKTQLTPVVRQLEIEDYYRVVIDWSHLRDMVYPELIPFSLGERIAYGATFSVRQTLEFCGTIGLALLHTIQGKLSLDNLGGPIMIGELAAQAGRVGWEKFLEMMALISINLALINLLPIPVLDGGNLMLYALEAIKRGPLSFRTRQIASYVGFAMILMLMVLAFKNDIERQWDNIVAIVND